VKPRGLTPHARYTVTTADGEFLGTSRGHELTRDGITIEESFESAARVLVLRADRPPRK
jgi:hypothetical protein